MWHGGGLDKAGRTRGFQLWIALPPELELGPTLSIYQAPEAVPQDGPVRVLLGSYGSASNAIVSPSPINYLAVRLKAGERWRYEPPTGHTVLWAAIASGVLSAPDELRHGDLAAFEPSSESVEFEALTDTGELAPKADRGRSTPRRRLLGERHPEPRARVRAVRLKLSSRQADDSFAPFAVRDHHRAG